MAELINPYANPYLPSFVNQRPVINNQQNSVSPPQMTYSGINFEQIHSVKGFEGARSRASTLSNGSSAILAEEDPNLSRVYIVAKDANGQIFVQGGDFVPVEEPKPVTMDDISNKMNQILDRLNKLEAETNDKPIHNDAGKDTKQSGYTRSQSNVRNNAGNSESGSASGPNNAR